MAYVPKCVYDVFLSYAHVDNMPAAGQPWVDRFKAVLETELRGELAVCVGEQRFVVWQDTERLKPGFALTQSIQEALGKTAVVVSLFSPGYLGSGYCADERRSFEAHCGERLRVGSTSRLINVVIRSSPEVIALAGSDLFARLFDAAGPLTPGADPFRDEFARLVRGIKGLLETMRQQFPKVYVALTGTGRNPEVVALASKLTASLLEDLSQVGYARTTEIHPGFYNDLQLENEIREAQASVHLVIDPADPLTRKQIELACLVGVPVLVWIAPSAQGADGEWIKQMVPGKGREYSTAPYSTFCERVKQVLTNSSQAPSIDSAARRNKTVFLVRNPRKDRDGADAVRRRLEGRGIDVTFEGQGWDELDGVLVYQRVADDRWFETKLKYVATAPVVRAACPVPPPDKSRALQAAQDYDFRPVTAVNQEDPRILLSGDQQQDLQPFLQAVLRG